MTGLELAIGTLALTASGAVSFWLFNVVNSGRDSFDDPELAEKAMRSAPYHRLDYVMSARR